VEFIVILMEKRIKVCGEMVKSSEIEKAIIKC